MGDVKISGGDLEKIVNEAAMKLFDFCDYPAVKYRILQLVGEAPDTERIKRLHGEFLHSDIVEQLYNEQDIKGGWGQFRSKDYSVKTVFPTSQVAIRRCLYIGLTYDYRDILMLANEYLEGILDGTIKAKCSEKNERANPWQTAEVCEQIEAIRPNNPICDSTIAQWNYIAGRAYEDGEYSYERDRAAQHEVFLTREARLVPMQPGLLLKRRGQLGRGIEEAMLCHLGEGAYHNGYFWAECPEKLPEEFVGSKTRRWFHSFNFINQFRGGARYLSHVVEWLLDNRNKDGIWDYGPQIKDPWGYFGNFSINRKYAHNRVVDCTMEILSFLFKYIENNTWQEAKVPDKSAT